MTERLDAVENHMKEQQTKNIQQITQLTTHLLPNNPPPPLLIPPPPLTSMPLSHPLPLPLPRMDTTSNQDKDEEEKKHKGTISNILNK